MRRQTQTVAKCSACGGECQDRVPNGWPFGVDMAAWVVFVLLALVGPLSRLSALPGVLAIFLSLLVVAVFALLWDLAARRLYHALWAWRHPARCGGGGVPEAHRL